MAIHRQTANRRHRWDRVRGLAGGTAGRRGRAVLPSIPSTGRASPSLRCRRRRSGQRWIAAAPGSTGPAAPDGRRHRDALVDRHHQPTSGSRPARAHPGPCNGVSSRLGPADWIGELAAAGDDRASNCACCAVNHLMASPSLVPAPALLLAGSRPMPTGQLPRPGGAGRAQSGSSGAATGGPSRRLTSSRVSASAAVLSGR